MENFNEAMTALVPEAKPQTVDFVVKEDFVEKLPQILSNVEQIKQWAIRQTERDRNLVLQTEEDFSAAKKRCADINRVVDNISAKRREVKKAYTAPYDLFETKLKEVTQVLQDARNNLWGQITAAEEQEKEKKRERIEEIYNELATDLQKEYRPLETIFDPKWLNKTTRLDAVREQITLSGLNVKNDVKAIRALRGTGDVAPLLLRYKDGASVVEIIDYNARLQAEAAKTAQKPVPAEEPKKDTAEPVIDVFTVDLRVVATREQFAELKEFLKQHNIKYGKVPKEEQNGNQ